MREKELIDVLNNRYKEIMNDPDIYESIQLSSKQDSATVNFHKGTKMFQAIFEYKTNQQRSYWYCVRDWND